MKKFITFFVFITPCFAFAQPKPGTHLPDSSILIYSEGFGTDTIVIAKYTYYQDGSLESHHRSRGNRRPIDSTSYVYNVGGTIVEAHCFDWVDSLGFKMTRKRFDFYDQDRNLIKMKNLRNGIEELIDSFVLQKDTLGRPYKLFRFQQKGSIIYLYSKIVYSAFDSLPRSYTISFYDISGDLTSSTTYDSVEWRDKFNPYLPEYSSAYAHFKNAVLEQKSIEKTVKHSAFAQTKYSLIMRPDSFYDSAMRNAHFYDLRGHLYKTETYTYLLVPKSWKFQGTWLDSNVYLPNGEILENHDGKRTTFYFYNGRHAGVFADLKSIGVFPNPFFNSLLFEGIEGKVHIYDGIGRIVFEGVITNGERIDLGYLAAGPYIVRAMVDGKMLHVKVIKSDGY